MRDSGIMLVSYRRIRNVLRVNKRVIVACMFSIFVLAIRCDRFLGTKRKSEMLTHIKDRSCFDWDGMYHMNLTKLLSELGMLSSHEACFTKMLWNGSHFLYSGHEFQVVCHQNSEAMYLRLELYSNILSAIFNQSGFTGKFCALFDLADATRNFKELYALMPDVPFFSFAKGRNDDRSILLPDPHFMLSVSWLEKREDIIPEMMKGFAQHVSQAYNETHFKVHGKSWDEKQNQMVYRGSCHPTIDPSTSIDHRINKRGLFCSASTYLSTMVDFAIKCSAVMDVNNACSACCDVKSLSRDYMARNFKYQLVIDGHGPSYDATIWKFLSKSTVFFGVPINTEEKTLSLFYYKVLRENRDFYIINEENWKHKIDFCRSHQDDCKKVAESGYEKITQILRWKYVEQYISSALLEVV